MAETAELRTLGEIERLLDSRGRLDQGELTRAYELALKAHAGQKRKTGDDYITHPLKAAEYLAKWELDQLTVMAGLLHDVIEDTDVTKDQIAKQFPGPLAELVDGVTKLGEIDLVSGNEAYVENLRKMFLAMAQDIRVLLIKLADRLHNMQTLQPLSSADRRRISKETLEVYAPLANRLGMGELKAELEDLAFMHLEPAKYEKLKRSLQSVLKSRSRYLSKMKRSLEETLKESGVKAEVEGRTKHYYSIAKKLDKQGELDKIYDLVAIRVIVPTVEDCYKTLGLIHQHFKPLIYRIKDYIAVPKPNGYQSLHTTVFGPEGTITEIQVRTPEMHEEAERGVAAHFHYDEMKGGREYREGKSSTVSSDKLTWVNQLMDWQKEMVEGEEFIEGLRIDFFRDRIFVFTPKGDVYDLPDGATSVDFAYHVHSKVGDSCVGAKVNGKILPLDRRLENRDIVEILTKKGAHPSQDWLGFVKTGQARSKIRAYFRSLNRDSHIEIGKDIVETELKRLGKERLEKIDKAEQEAVLRATRVGSLEELYAGLGDGSTRIGTVVRSLFGEEELRRPRVKPRKKGREAGEGKVVVAGHPDLLVTFKSCCHPVAGEAIVGVVTRGHGVAIHKADCSSLAHAKAERLLEAHWSGMGEVLSAYLTISANERVGLVRDITTVISDSGIPISSLQMDESDEEISIQLVVQIESIERLRELLRRLEQVNGVVSVRRG
jgi:GTP pyrophosphokinase